MEKISFTHFHIISLWEIDKQNYLQQKYQYPISPHPTPTPKTHT